jgi:hypothetical protein
MTPRELAPWIRKHPVAPKGWEPLATLPIDRFEPIEFLAENGETRQDTCVSNLFFVCMSPPRAWRSVTSGPVYEGYWRRRERLANLAATQ